MAISIPIFTAQLEKAREAVDAANIRAEYAELATAVLTGDYNATTDATKYQVTLKQETNGWSTTFDFPDDLNESGTPAKDGTATLTYSSTADKPFTVTYSSSS